MVCNVPSVGSEERKACPRVLLCDVRPRSDRDLYVLAVRGAARVTHTEGRGSGINRVDCGCDAYCDGREEGETDHAFHTCLLVLFCFYSLWSAVIVVLVVVGHGLALEG